MIAEVVGTKLQGWAVYWKEDDEIRQKLFKARGTEGALNYTRLMLGIDKESIVQLAPYLMGVDAGGI